MNISCRTTSAPPQSLIDPQKLLAEVESNDVIELIKLIKSRYNVNLFVSIFAAGRKSPLPSMLPPSPARYSGTRSATCCSISHGEFKSAQIALDPELSSQLGDADGGSVPGEAGRFPIHQSAGRTH
ncbi:MAG: hypothetical protein ACLT38_03105 [Akkermansia sp.]